MESSFGPTAPKAQFTGDTDLPEKILGGKQLSIIYYKLTCNLILSFQEFSLIWIMV